LSRKEGFCYDDNEFYNENGKPIRSGARESRSRRRSERVVTPRKRGADGSAKPLTSSSANNQRVSPARQVRVIKPKFSLPAAVENNPKPKDQEAIAQPQKLPSPREEPADVSSPVTSTSCSVPKALPNFSHSMSTEEFLGMEKKTLELEQAKEQVEELKKELTIVNQELINGKEKLKTANEELEAANKELKTANEVLKTVNEKLKQQEAGIQNLASEIDVVKTQKKQLTEKFKVQREQEAQRLRHAKGKIVKIEYFDSFL
jgi:myosin heavy subunit